MASFISLHTPQVERNEKLKSWMVCDGMSSIVFHFTPFIFYKLKQWNLIIYHPIPSHSITHHQSKHNPRLCLGVWRGGKGKTLRGGKYEGK